MAEKSSTHRQTPWKRETRTFVVVWLGVAAIFIGSHFYFYFSQPHYEGGDFAANALQIRQAKDFREIHGNYSRFGFHHPGPAFFYAYAFGEVILFDTLKIVPAPYNAHAITGILIQALFFAWAMVIVARRVRRSLLLPLMLVFAGVHFGIVNYNIPDSAFQSIWPPYVLLFPFLCFIVACASFASGEIKDLIPCVIAGGLLVHGHVAQPLFVLPWFTTACAAFWFLRQTTDDKSRRPSAVLWTCVSAACIVGVFLLPIILDACKGEQSNLHLIFQHLTQQTSDHKSFAQSVIYLAAFFYYVGSPEQYCDQLALSKLTFFVERMPFLWMWILITIVILAAPKPSFSSERRFFFSLASFFAGGVVLTLIWAHRQNAEMFAFNSYFNFALLFVLFILAAIAIASFPRLQRTVYPAGVLYVLSVPLLLLASRNLNWSSDMPTMPRNTEKWFERVRQAAITDKQTARKKFLSFVHADWPWAVGVALALERIGFEYAIPPDWAFMFDPKRVADLPTSLFEERVALWKIRSPATAGDDWIGNSPAAVDPASTEILFSGAGVNAAPFVVSGWDVSNGAFSWTTARRSLLLFSSPPTHSDVEITLEVFPADFSQNKVQRMLISYNGKPLQEFQVSDSSILKARIPASAWNSRPFGVLAFDFPDATSPLAAGVSADPRIISCGFKRIVFYQATPQQ